MFKRLNNTKWFVTSVLVNIDRLSVLSIVGLIELAIRHPDMAPLTKKSAAKLGKTLALTLLDDGLIIPDQVRESWERTFNMSIKPERDIIIPGLTNQEGRPWK